MFRHLGPLLDKATLKNVGTSFAGQGCSSHQAFQGAQPPQGKRFEGQGERPDSKRRRRGRDVDPPCPRQVGAAPGPPNAAKPTQLLPDLFHQQSRRKHPASPPSDHGGLEASSRLGPSLHEPAEHFVAYAHQQPGPSRSVAFQGQGGGRAADQSQTGWPDARRQLLAVPAVVWPQKATHPEPTEAQEHGSDAGQSQCTRGLQPGSESGDKLSHDAAGSHGLQSGDTEGGEGLSLAAPAESTEDDPWNLLVQLQGNAVWNLIGLRYKQATMKQSRLAQQVESNLKALR